MHHQPTPRLRRTGRAAEQPFQDAPQSLAVKSETNSGVDSGALRHRPKDGVIRGHRTYRYYMRKVFLWLPDSGYWTFAPKLPRPPAPLPPRNSTSPCPLNYLSEFPCRSACPELVEGSPESSVSFRRSSLTFRLFVPGARVRSTSLRRGPLLLRRSVVTSGFFPLLTAVMSVLDQ